MLIPFDSALMHPARKHAQYPLTATHIVVERRDNVATVLDSSAILPARLLLMGALVSTGSREDLVANMVHLADHRRRSGYVCFMNVHMLVESSRKPYFRDIVNEAAICCPDGVPVAKSLSWVHGMRQRHLPGPDALPQLLQAVNSQRKTIFLVGGTEAMIQRFLDRMKREYPQVAVGGYDCPPFKDGVPEVDQNLVARINGSQADMIIVALGCPKQERWMAEHAQLLNGCMFGLGYAVPVYAGMARRAPCWMVEHGLEWLFRLYIQPKRLFWRYFKTNTWFLAHVGISILRRMVPFVSRISS